MGGGTNDGPLDGEAAAQRAEYEAFFRNEFRKVMGTVMRVGATVHEAENATQFAMADAWRQWHRIPNPAGWVRTAAVRAFTKSLKRDQKGAVLAAVAYEDLKPVYYADDAEECATVIRTLRSLSRVQMQVMALKYDGYSEKEIAEILGKDRQTVRSNLAAARKKLRRTIADPHQRRRDTDHDKRREA